MLLCTAVKKKKLDPSMARTEPTALEKLAVGGKDDDFVRRVRKENLVKTTDAKGVGVVEAFDIPLSQVRIPHFGNESRARGEPYELFRPIDPLLVSKWEAVSVSFV